jgi:hypothetical protein
MVASEGHTQREEAGRAEVSFSKARWEPIERVFGSRDNRGARAEAYYNRYPETANNPQVG